jgi:hypothetical protein
MGFRLIFRMGIFVTGSRGRSKFLVSSLGVGGWFGGIYIGLSCIEWEVGPGGI